MIYYLKAIVLLFQVYKTTVVAQSPNSNQWQQVSYRAVNSIYPRRTHAGAFMNSTNEYLVLGGFTNWTQDHLSDFHSINLTTANATQISANTPLGIRAAMAYTSSSTDFFIHCGYRPDVYLSDFWKFDVQTRNWTHLARGPSARAYHCLELDNSRNLLILFGGWNSTVYFDDLWTYSIGTNQWEQLSPVGSTRPIGRASHACAVNSESSKFYFHGGRQFSNIFYHDLWYFDFIASTWILIDAENSNVQLTGHKMRYSQPMNSLFLIFGYQISVNSYLNTIYRYSFNNPQPAWELFQVNWSQVPSVRQWFSDGFNPQTGEYFVFAGIGPRDEYIDLWKIYLNRTDDQFSTTTSEISTVIVPQTETPEKNALSKFTIPTSMSYGSSSLTTTLVPNQLQDYTTSDLIYNDNSSSAMFALTEFPNLDMGKNLNAPQTEPASSGGLKNTYQYYVIAGAFALLVCAWMLCLYRRKRKQKRESEVMNETLEAPNFTGDSSGDLTFSSSNFTTSMSRTSGSGHSNMSVATLVATEAGLSVPAYLEIQYSMSVREKEVLAEGGFGTVSLADALTPQLRQFGDQVIVKQLKQSELSDRNMKLFYQEISLMEYFKNEQYIAKLLGYSTEPFCLIMKYYPLGSLTKMIKKTRNRCKIHVLAFSRDIAAGLWTMHQKGVVHNDLKPDNVLLDRTPKTRQPFCILSDLGISQIVTQQILKVKQFEVVNINGLSMKYAAPERIMVYRRLIAVGQPDLQSIFSWDVYSLGIVMYELLTANSKLY